MGRNPLKLGRMDGIPLFYGRVLQMDLYGSTDEACGRVSNLLSDSAQYSESHENRKSIECLYLLQAFPKKPVTKHTACFNISGLACTKGASF